MLRYVNFPKELLQKENRGGNNLLMRRNVTLYLSVIAVIGTMIVAVPLLAGHQVSDATIADAQTKAAPVQLLMVRRDGCHFCTQFEQQIAPGYPHSAEGRLAPLLRVNADGPWPDGLALARTPYLTPTFILIQNGSETGRLEGYAGSEFFYPLLNKMLASHGLLPKVEAQ